MTTCPACGVAIRPGAAFCGECGAQLPAVVTPAAERPNFITLPPGVVPVAATNTGPAPSVAARAAAAPPPPSFAPPAPPTVAPPALPLAPPPLARLPVSVQPATPQSVIAEVAPSTDVDATQMAAPRRLQTWSLVLPDGSAHTIATSAVIGRAPDAAAHGAAAAISVGADQKSVSKSHALIEVSAQGLRVRDLGSVNGVVVAHADGRESEASATNAVDLGDGDELELGEIVIAVKRV